MLRRLAPIVIATALLLAAAGAARAQPVEEGNVLIRLDGGFTPHALPRERAVPVDLEIDGSIGTTDGTQPPPLQRLRIAVNRHGVLTTRGLPTCSSPSLQSTTSQVAMARCGPALVGHGSFGASVLSPSPSPIPLSGKILAFNGTQGGRPVVLLHLYGTVPIQATFVFVLHLEHPAKGQFGTVLSARIPRIAGGTGAITKLNLTIGRSYRYRGQTLGYASAKCAAPQGFTQALFSFARVDFYLAGSRHLHTTLTRSCRVR